MKKLARKLNLTKKAKPQQEDTDEKKDPDENADRYAKEQQLTQHDYLAVAAIDFGTTFSGYAFSFKGRNEIFMNKNWGAGLGHLSYKAPTSVLIDQQDKCIAFGYEAEQMYNEYCDSNAAGNYELYRHFKMFLHDQRTISRKAMVQSVSGKWENALVVFSYAIGYLKDHLQQALGKINPEDIRWVLTVPAIWSEQSKYFMREAAFKAGLIQQINSPQLVICLEPEAAAVHCQSIRAEEFTLAGQDATNPLIQAGTKYMVVDAGGGTVDICVHEIQTDGCIKELQVASGGACGGTHVDENFVQLMRAILGGQFIEWYLENRPKECLEMRVSFERQKINLKPSAKNYAISISLNCAIPMQYQEVTGKDIYCVLKDIHLPGVRFHNGSIVINYDAANGLFDSAVNSILEYTTKVMSSTRDLNLIVLVGGFGECQLLQDALKTRMPSRIPIFCPLEAGTAVMKGAVIYGQNEQLITSRISRKTYGVSILGPFDSRLDHPGRKITTARGDRCKLFRPLVKKNEMIGCNSMYESIGSVSYTDQTILTIKIYSTEKSDVRYTDDPDLIQLGLLRVHLPDTSQGLARKVRCQFYFGTTVLFVVANEISDMGGGREVEAQIDLLT